VGERTGLDEAEHFGGFILGVLTIQRLAVIEHLDDDEGVRVRLLATSK